MEASISIIVPVYNVEPYIRKCVDSILCQTYRALEIILVDDGSPDNCGAICDEYAVRDSRVKVIHKPNGGLSDARNAGLAVATGAYIGFVDSDDWIAPDMFEYLLRGLIGNDAQISVCGVTNAYQYQFRSNREGKDIVMDAGEALNELFFDRMENYAWNKLYLAELWRDIRYPVGKNFEDILTIYKTFERADRIAVLQEEKYFYRIRPDSISGTKDFSNRLHIYRALIERYEEAAGRLPTYRAALFCRFRNWYIKEISEEVVKHPDRRGESLKLLGEVAPFVARHKDEIADELHISKLERKKWDAFALGTVAGCRASLRYHKRMQRRQKTKARLRRWLKL